VHEVLDVGGAPALVTEVSAGSIEAWIARHGALSPRRVAEIGLQAAEALAHLHAAGIVHRRVSARSLKIRPDGSVMLGDLEGVAERRADGSNAERDVAALRATLRRLCSATVAIPEALARCFAPGPLAELRRRLEEAVSALPADRTSLADDGLELPDDPFAACVDDSVVRSLRERVAGPEPSIDPGDPGPAEPSPASGSLIVAAVAAGTLVLALWTLLA
jgi:hypothetical protein